MNYFNLLSKEQKQAVTTISGPLLCLAGPGSGKTFTLVCRLRFLIESHRVPPDSILVLTYSKAAALSMQRRFNMEMQEKTLPVVFGTFHAICYHILKEHYHFSQNSLLSHTEKIQALQSILQFMPDQSPEEENCETILGCISLFKNGKKIEDLPLPAGLDAEDFVKIYREYRHQNRKKGKLDFDDMLLLCLELFLKEQNVLIHWQKRFSYILVDEFQDCNRIQYEVVKKLAYPENNFFVVGDDDQSIYGFRGASPDILQQFLQDFQGAGRILLGGNYRSRPEIIEAVEKVISENEKRMPKTLYAVGEAEGLAGREPVRIKGFNEHRMQFQYLTEQLKVLQTQMAWEEMAVIFRTNQEMAALLPYLLKENIPYNVRGGKNNSWKNPYEHFAVQDILAYLRFAVGEHSRKLFISIMNKPGRGIKRELLWEEEVDLIKLANELEKKGKQEAAALRRLFSRFEKMQRMSPYLAIEFVRKGMGYDRWLRGRAGEEPALYEEWKEKLDGVQQSARGFTRIGEWLAFVEQKKEEAEHEAAEDMGKGVNLMTLHGSKGLEFTYVCLPNLNEGKLPHGKLPGKETIEEERRLFYVGMTRAKKALELLYLTGTEERPRQPSRFLQPLLMTGKTYSLSSASNSSNS